MTMPERDAEGSAVCDMLGAVLLQDAEPSQQFIDEHPAVRVLIRLKRECAELRELIVRVVTGDGAQLENLEMTEEEWNEGAGITAGGDDIEISIRREDWFALIRAVGGTVIQEAPRSEPQTISFITRCEYCGGKPCHCEEPSPTRPTPAANARRRGTSRLQGRPLDDNGAIELTVQPRQGAAWACSCGVRAETAGEMAAHLKDAHGKE